MSVTKERIVCNAEVIATIRENFDREVTECPGDKGASLNYSVVIPPRQFEYYLWWRTCVRHGQYPKVRKDAVILFFYELLIMGRPFEEIERWAILLSKAYEGTESSSVANYVSFSAGLMLGRFSDSPATDIISERRQFIFAGPSIVLDDDFIRLMLECSPTLPQGSSELISRTFEVLAERLWEERDIGVIEYLSNQRVESIFVPFGRLFPASRMKIILNEPLFTEHAFKKMCNIMKYCIWNLDRKFARNPGRLDDLVKSSVATALSDMKSGRPRPSEWLPLRTMCVSANDRLMRGTYQRKMDAVFMPTGAIRIVPKCDIVSYSKNDWRAVMAEFFGDGQCVESGYVPSPNTHPLPSEIDDAQRNYYLYWRAEMRRNRFLDTDLGYLSLRCLELIEGEGYVNERAAELHHLARAYECDVTFDACIGFALENGLRLPPLIASPDRLAHLRFHDSLRAKPITLLSHRDLKSIIPSHVPDQYLNVDPFGHSLVVNYLLNRFDETMLENEGERIIDLVGDSSRYKVKVWLYEKLNRYGITRGTDVNHNFPFNDMLVCSIFKVCILVAARYVCVANGSTAPQISSMDDDIVADAERFIGELGPYEDLCYPLIGGDPQ